MLQLINILALFTSSALSAPTSSWWPKGGPSWGPPHYPPGHGGHGHGGEPTTNIVDLGYAKYQGTTLLPANVNQFLGIRFAAPPLGDLRWRAPADPISNASDEILPATEFQPTCLGLFGGGLSENIQEDCLYLNVFAPTRTARGERVTTKSKLPVWFFIQGGGYAGDTDANFNATEIIQRSGGEMIMVQINYRVGVFGFLASERVREDGDLNVGLLDQRKAMHWVQKYIHLFGGDPNHVVIHGDSAGGGSIAHHLVAYGGRNDHLFVGGIAESPFWPTQRTVLEMEFQFEVFARNFSCPLEEDVMSCLRSKDTATLQGSDVVSPFPGAPASPDPTWYFLPVIDGDFSTDYLYNLFEQGKTVRVPLIVGDDTDEGTAFSPNANTSSQFLNFIDANYPNLNARNLQQISTAYPENAFPSFPNHGPYFPATAQAYGEMTFVCPGIEMSTSLSKYNSPAKSWNYRYNVQDQGYISAGLGVPHVSEKPAIWGPNNAGLCGDPCSYETYNAAIVPIVMDHWISFITTLNPNSRKNPEAPKWETWEQGGWWGYGRGELRRLKLETNATVMETVPKAQLERCGLWKKLAGITEQ